MRKSGSLFLINLFSLMYLRIFFSLAYPFLGGVCRFSRGCTSVGGLKGIHLQIFPFHVHWSLGPGTAHLHLLSQQLFPPRKKEDTPVYLTLLPFLGNKRLRPSGEQVELLIWGNILISNHIISL